ncbi:hypothetical protein [Granulicella arctica]|uniref:Uncharacterized protein n=1 Tax=Granulicella arctica TaxID=940613 RepID=A0A7Y9PH85_9BACT|nr:hypothetical protein [Granulicella arctica]NYF79680.1 hypothetical protein [Granulicella arctica]
MNPHDSQHNAELDRRLAAHLGPDALQPSSGFTASVMDAIHKQAATQTQPAEAFPPIPFPWKRLLPIAIVLLALLATFLIAVAPQLAHSLTTSNQTNFDLVTVNTPAATYLWASLATILSLIIAATSFKLATSRR